MQRRLCTKLIYLSVVVCIISTIALIPSPVFGNQVNSNLIEANTSKDHDELVAQVINQQTKEKTAVTVDGDKYYIVILKNRIDPTTLEPQFNPDFTKEVKVYTDLEGAPVSDHATVKKIQYIDSVRRWSHSRASAASIKEDIQIIDDFTGAMLKVRKYQLALDWIAVGGGKALQLFITGSLNPGASVSAFAKEIPDQLKSTFYNPKNGTAIFGYIIMNQAKSYLMDALVIAQRGEISDYDTAQQFMDSYISGWSEFSPAYSMVFESFVQGSWLDDLGSFTSELAKNVVLDSLDEFLGGSFASELATKVVHDSLKKNFGNIDKVEKFLDLMPVMRYNQLKNECYRSRDTFLEADNAHAEYTLALAGSTLTPGKIERPVEPVQIRIESNDALLETQGGERIVSPGDSINFSISAFNAGNTTWTEDSQYRLGWLSGYEPFPNGTDNIRRTISLGEAIRPGEEKIWKITGLISPSKEGTYAIRWQMVKEGVEWFGNSVTINIKVKADSPSPLLAQINPAIVISPPTGPPGTIFAVRVSGCTPNSQVTVEYETSVPNTGKYTWTKTCTSDNRGNSSTTLSWDYKGDYSVWVRDQATRIESKQVRVTVGYPAVSPTIVISPASGQRADLTPYSPLNSNVTYTFDIIVTGCTPNNEVRVHYLGSVVGSGYAYEWGKTLKTDNQGKAHTTLSWSYKGEWDVWMVDKATGIKSSTVTATVK